MAKKREKVEITLETVAESVGKLNKQINSLKSAVGDLKKRADTFKSAVGDLKKRADTFEPHITEKFLSSIEADAVNLHERLKMLINKQAVATESCWYAQKMIPEAVGVISRNAIKAMENDDEWWDERKEFTLEQWMNELCDTAQLNDIVFTSNLSK